MKLKNIVYIVNSVGIAFFTISNVQHCLNQHINNIASVVLGVLTVITGGLLRDVLCNEVPSVFKKELNASAVISGGILFIILNRIMLPQLLKYFIPITAIIVIRLISRRYNISLPSVYLHTGKNK